MIEQDYNELLALLKRIESIVDLHTQLLLELKEKVKQ